MVGSAPQPRPRLPVAQLAILALCRLAEPVASTSVFPYLPEMIESFGVPSAGVARWAGITSAVFCLAQCCTAVPWGRASDRFGRKPVVMAGTTVTMITSVIWGLSTSLPWAITARALAGASNGNVGIMRTMVAELVPERELQPRAFSVLPLVWSFGSTVGPAMGGFFARPADRMPWLFGDSVFLRRFPFALPNLMASGLFLCGLVVCALFMRETLARWPDGADDGEPKPARATRRRPGLSEVCTRPTLINLAAYMVLSLHSVAFDQLIPVFLHHPRQARSDPAVSLPLRFAGGFGLGSDRIGILFTIFGLCGGLVQFLIFPPVARRIGILNCLRACTVAFPLLYLATPFPALFEDTAHQQAAILTILVAKSICIVFAFPCSTILLTNSASSLRILGTLNGFATSLAAAARGIGPALLGFLFSWGVGRGYVITPWWVLAFIAALGIVPAWHLEETDGLHTHPDGDEADGDEAERPLLVTDVNASPQADLSDERTPLLSPTSRSAASQSSTRSQRGEPFSRRNDTAINCQKDSDLDRGGDSYHNP